MHKKCYLGGFNHPLKYFSMTSNILCISVIGCIISILLSTVLHRCLDIYYLEPHQLHTTGNNFCTRSALNQSRNKTQENYIRNFWPKSTRFYRSHVGIQLYLSLLLQSWRSHYSCSSDCGVLWPAAVCVTHSLVQLLRPDRTFRSVGSFCLNKNAVAERSSMRTLR